MGKNTVTLKNIKLADASGLTLDFKKVSETKFTVYVRQLRKTIVVRWHKAVNGRRPVWSAECKGIINNGYSLGKTAEQAWDRYVGMINSYCNFN